MILQENVDLVTHLGKIEDFWILQKKFGLSWMWRMQISHTQVFVRKIPIFHISTLLEYRF